MQIKITLSRYLLRIMQQKRAKRRNYHLHIYMAYENVTNKIIVAHR
jgi:hypothetical protein